ncbi:hypothetical protein KCP77_15755 [Salmonella enterica subsp. enterica]|nr:hypothetical protein KCP77_15755 [Salmonella enterica subsp. enterica]
MTHCAGLSVRCRKTSGCTGAASVWRSSPDANDQIRCLRAITKLWRRPSTNTSRTSICQRIRCAALMICWIG